MTSHAVDRTPGPTALRLRAMNKRNASSGVVVLVVAAAAAGIAAYLRRPVKPPTQTGSWHPVESQRARRP